MIHDLLHRFIRNLTDARRPPDFIIGGEDNPYMLRWYVIPRNRFFNIYYHIFLRSDDDRALVHGPLGSIGARRAASRRRSARIMGCQKGLQTALEEARSERDAARRNLEVSAALLAQAEEAIRGVSPIAMALLDFRWLNLPAVIRAKREKE